MPCHAVFENAPDMCVLFDGRFHFLFPFVHTTNPNSRPGCRGPPSYNQHVGFFFTTICVNFYLPGHFLCPRSDTRFSMDVLFSSQRLVYCLPLAQVTVFLLDSVSLLLCYLGLGGTWARLSALQSTISFC